MPIQSNLKGQKFYSLEVLEEIPNKRINGSVAWKCKCDCGKIIECNTKQLTSGRKESCGCTRYSKKQREYEEKMSSKPRKFGRMSEKSAREFAYLVKDFLEIPDDCCETMVDRLKNCEYEEVVFFILLRKRQILKGEED